jgi:protoheme IX farnesyltransferase
MLAAERQGLTPTRLASAFVWLAVLVAAGTALTVVTQSVARVALPSGLLDSFVSGLWLGWGVLAVAVAVTAWLVHRDAPALLVAASLAPILVGLRLAASGLLVALELPTLASVVESALGLGVLGVLVCSAAFARSAPRANGRSAAAAEEFFRRVVEVTIVAVFAAGLSGVAVRAVGAAWACSGFPDCNGLGLLPFGRDDVLTDIHLYHRMLGYVATALVVWIAVEARRVHPHAPTILNATLAFAALTLAQGAVGAIAVSIGVPVVAQALHAFGGVGVWMLAILVGVLTHRQPVISAVHPVTHRWFTTLRAYAELMKPGVLSLLLLTTWAAMIIAQRGLPPLPLVVMTLLGGALMAGGAGAINHYIDRDIDPLMGRTATRPIPAGLIAPHHALWFGIGSSVVAALLLAIFVNPLAAGLAIAGLLGYVFVYSLWLKRSTPSNIVIGGAAGAIPPLVGWAAVTNEIGSLTAWYLFAIIFFWTPPHFWALSLLIRRHYETARVPMLPVVRGDEETRRQILLYSLVLVALTLVLSPFGLMGLVYFAAAGLLGSVFIVAALVLWREATARAALRLYLYSIAYLFALFIAMAVDRLVAGGKV